jgi:hypothetical protein
MIVAMFAMFVMQPTIDQVVGMVAVRDRLMSTTLPMDMILVMAAGSASIVAAVRISIRNLDHVLVNMILVRVVQMAVMQIVHMILMTYGRVSAIRAVSVRMMAMGLMARHDILLWLDT